MASDTFTSSLLDTPASRLTEDRGALVHLNASSTVEEAEHLMKHLGVSSLPIYNDGGNCIGILDSLGVVLIRAFQTCHKAPFLDLRITPESRLSQAFGFFSNLEKDVVWHLKADASLRELIAEFATGTHRIMLLDQCRSGSSRPSSHDALISQSDVLRFLSWQESPAGSRYQQILDRKLATLPPAPVESITEKQSALEGFKQMFLTTRRQLAVLDSEGKLAGELTASDALGYDECSPDMELPALEFKQRVQSKLQKGRAMAILPAADTVGAALRLIASHQLHCAWLVNEKGEPARCVTMTDLIGLFNVEGAPLAQPGAVGSVFG